MPFAIRPRTWYVRFAGTAAPCSLAVASVRADTANFRSDPPTKGRVLAIFAALGSALEIPSASVLVGDYFWGHLRNEPSPPIREAHVLSP